MTGEKDEEESLFFFFDSSFISEAVYDCMRAKGKRTTKKICRVCSVRRFALCSLERKLHRISN